MNRTDGGGMTDREETLQEERLLLERILEGDSRAFSEFYRRYQRLVASCVRKVFLKWSVDFTEDEIDDVIGSVFLGFLQNDYRKLRMFDPQRGFRLSTWVGIIATNATVDHIRRNPASTVSYEDTFQKKEIRSSFLSPAEHLERAEEQRLLEAAMEMLSPGDREFLKMIYELQLQPEEIATRLQLNINTVYSKKNKIIHKLADAVRELSTARLAR